MTYAQLLNKLTLNAQLHLFFKMAYSTGFTPIRSRNSILVQYLKPLVNQPEYKLVKKDIKKLLVTGRKSGADLQSKIEELSKLSLPESSYQTDLDHFIGFIHHTEKLLNTKVQYSTTKEIDTTERYGHCLICLIDVDLNIAFDFDSKLQRPIVIHFYGTPKYKATFFKAIQDTEYFSNSTVTDEPNFLSINIWK